MAIKNHRLTVPTIDAQLAATALQHSLTFATQNASDVKPTGVTIFNLCDEETSVG